MIRHFFCFAELPSTNTYALKLSEEQSRAGFLIWAGRQTAGHGQKDRNWLAPSGTICSTWLLAGSPALPRPTLINLLAGLAVSQTLDEYVVNLASPQLSTHLKWPNDVYAVDKKISGILTEAAWLGKRAKIAVGMGINLNNRSFPAQINTQAVSVYQISGQLSDEWIFIQKMLARLQRLFDLWQADTDKLLAGIKLKCHTLGKLIIWQTGSQVRQGRAFDVAPDGGLMIELLDGQIVHYIDSLSLIEISNGTDR